MDLSPLPPNLVVSRREALAAGLSETLIARLLRSGRWHRVLAGDYWTGPLPPPPIVAAAVAVERTGGVGIVSHQTAALVLGMPGAARGGPLHVTLVPGSSSGSSQRVRVHRRQTPPGLVRLRVAAGRWTAGCSRPLATVVVTDVATTLVDLATTLPRHQSAWMASRAVAEGRVDRAGLTAAVPAVGRAGRQVALRMLADLEPHCVSPLEMALLLLMRDAGLPQPQINVVVRDGDGVPIAEADFWFGDGLLDVEADGYDAHSTVKSVFADRQRENGLAAIGARVLRFTWPDVFKRPEWVAMTIRGALGSRSAAA